MARPHKKAIPVSPGLAKIRRTRGLALKIANTLGISRQAVSDWPEIPIGRVAEVEHITGIPREQLRPDIFRRRKRKR